MEDYLLWWDVDPVTCPADGSVGRIVILTEPAIGTSRAELKFCGKKF